ncbi:MAG: MinD/ParA family protein [Anaerolineae bacterium]
MSKIMSIHSFRGGTGKSNTTANLTTIYAMQGYRVGVVDTDIQSPGIHVLFGIEEEDMVHSLNDFLWGQCEIEEAALDVTDRLGAHIPGKIFLIPSSIKAGEIARVLREGYDVGLLNDGFNRLLDALQLDLLLIDTHPGLNEQTLLSIAISDALAIILRPDQQDYQGTAVTVEVARKLEVPKLVLILNKVPVSLGLDTVKERVERTYHCPVAGVLPHSDELMLLASSGVFSVQYPTHPVTATYKQIAATLLS